jgi:hypothetical protein
MVCSFIAPSTSKAFAATAYDSYTYKQAEHAVGHIACC